MQKHPIENVWVDHECPTCKQVDKLVNVHSLVYVGNPQCGICDESMEPLSGEAEVEDMNERFARIKAEGQH